MKELTIKTIIVHDDIAINVDVPCVNTVWGEDDTTQDGDGEESDLSKQAMQIVRWLDVLSS